MRITDPSAARGEPLFEFITNDIDDRLKVIVINIDRFVYLVAHDPDHEMVELNRRSPSGRIRPEDAQRFGMTYLLGHGLSPF
jgi:hypothetical protein